MVALKQSRVLKMREEESLLWTIHACPTASPLWGPSGVNKWREMKTPSSAPPTGVMSSLAEDKVVLGEIAQWRQG